MANTTNFQGGIRGGKLILGRMTKILIDDKVKIISNDPGYFKGPRSAKFYDSHRKPLNISNVRGDIVSVTLEKGGTACVKTREFYDRKS